MRINLEYEKPKLINLTYEGSRNNNIKVNKITFGNKPKKLNINKFTEKSFISNNISVKTKYNNFFYQSPPFQNNNFRFHIDYSNIIGKGPFATVYLGVDSYTGQKVAVKMEPKKNSLFCNSYLKKEIDVYSKLGSYKSIPKIYWSGANSNYNILVLELLGSSLEKVFLQRFKKFSLSETINIGLKILDILEYIHNRNIIHRDIKTTCFYIKENDISINSNIYILDFGNAKEYIDPITGYHIPLTLGNSYIGDYRFSSINSFLGYEKSRRDDIESLGYILIYFLKGSLPWYNYKDKNLVKKKKLSISLDDLCSGLPSGIKDFIQHSFNLNFSDKPNYSYLRNLLTNCQYGSIKRISVFKKRNKKNLTLGSKKKEKKEKKYIHLNDEQFETVSRHTNTEINEEDRDIIEKNYIKNRHSMEFNKILRTLGPFGLNEEDLKLFYALNNVINSQETKENYFVYRYVDNNFLKNVFNFEPSNYDINYNLYMINNQIGSIKVEKGFMSCYMTERHVIERNIKLKVKIPEGSHAYITRNKLESEIILPYNTKYKILGAYIIGLILIQIDIIILKEKSYQDDDLESLRKPMILRKEDFINFK